MKGKKTGGRTAGTPNKPKVVRPMEYGAALGLDICDLVASGKSLATICVEEWAHKRFESKGQF